MQPLRVPNVVITLVNGDTRRLGDIARHRKLAKDSVQPRFHANPMDDAADRIRLCQIVAGRRSKWVHLEQSDLTGPQSRQRSFDVNTGSTINELISVDDKNVVP